MLAPNARPPKGAVRGAQAARQLFDTATDDSEHAILKAIVLKTSWSTIGGRTAIGIDIMARNPLTVPAMSQSPCRDKPLGTEQTGTVPSPGQATWRAGRRWAPDSPGVLLA